MADPAIATRMIRRRSHARSAEKNRPPNAATETNAEVELNGSVASDAMVSHHTGVRCGGRSTHVATVSNKTAQNASLVYCFRSLRPSESGASIAIRAAAIPANRARGFEAQASERPNTYANAAVSTENASTTSRARCIPVPGTSFSSAANPTGVLRLSPARRDHDVFVSTATHASSSQ